MSDVFKTCPQCNCEYAYELNETQYACPDCGHEWNPNDVVEEEQLIVLDANGNKLSNGDTVIVIKDLPVKGAAKPLRAGTKVKNIRLTEGDHNISCKIDGFGAMALKSEYVKKV
ncbi:MAG: alkylphosphonate utilization protein [Chitinophagaceae bacterium]|nr:alkylphosphonate utilization protein [Chitinophagaceae bacterium]MCW5905736.1 alkylphosphonate utilization protein [Chitinophagaceae bacterium]